MSHIKVGSAIKLAGSVFPQDKAEINMSSHYGYLGYPGIMYNWGFRVIDVFEHDPHGTILKCETVNVKGAIGEVYLRAADCVPAVMKVTVDYQILDPKIDKSKLLEQRGLLVQEMSQAIASDKYKKTGRKCTALRKGIENIDRQLQASESVTEVYLPRIKQKFTIESSLLQNKSAFENHLAGLVSGYRSGLKKMTGIVSKPVEKTVMNHYKIQLVGGVHTKPNVYGEIYDRSLVDLIRADKKPSDPNKNYLGIEIECLVREDANLEELFVKERLHKNVQVTGDSSIDVCSDSHKAVELRVLTTEDELESVMMRIGRVLRNKKVDAYANRSCGLHVHLDMRNRDHIVSYQRLFNVQSLLRKSQPAGRQLSSYCKPNTQPTFKECERRDNERYSVINTNAFKKLGTLEVRIHEGTVNTVSMINWCKFLVGVLASDITTKVTSVDQIRGFDIPRAGLDYVANRIAEFGDEEEAIA